MFERDKDELRELGILLVTSVIDPVFDDELGYRIDKREYALPEISFEPDEVAALSLAARTWTRASLAAGRHRAPQAAGGRSDDGRRLTGGHRAGGPHDRGSLRAAAQGGPRPARGDVRLPQAGRRAPRGTSSRGARSVARSLVPHGIRPGPGAARVFRVGRIDTAVTATGGRLRDPRRPRPTRDGGLHADADVAAPGRDAQGAGGQRQRALRRRAQRQLPTDDEERSGWSTVEVDFRDVDRLADEVAGYGPRSRSPRPTSRRRSSAGSAAWRASASPRRRGL